MRALTSLHQDHHTLLALTDALEAFSRALRTDESVGPQDIGPFARAFREFADNVHYEKEEQVLLPFLARHGFDWHGDLIEQVRTDHERERYLIDVLHQAAQRDGTFNRDDRRRLATTAAALAHAQRDLTMRQDIELFPEISLLDSGALEHLHEQLALFDLSSSRRRAELRQLIGGLARRYVC